ncbi:peptide deformylase, mitochondrial [Scyliorhinus canicula]|uniref:peptide deformylase, mitochondrial n=1 Tax=Scyliorhinus canicula TaxID=7830 RepID=UPI0018F39D5B|nr:peptide deformylase, mitochondrial [Scyliorhinus canicula]
MLSRSHSLLRLPRPPGGVGVPASGLSGAAGPRVKQRSYWAALRRWLWGPAAPPFPRPCLAGHPVLRAEAAAVPEAEVRGPEVQRLVAALVRTMRREGALGLSAPQLGVPLQVMVLEVTPGILEAEAPSASRARGMVTVPLRILINPRLRVLDSRTSVWPEACHSLPGLAACVARYRSVEVTGLDETGQPVCWQASDWTARILQHEMDHLKGQLYVDKMDSRTLENLQWMEEND